MIVILSGAGDLHADAVEERLRTRAVDVHRLDTSRFPDDITVASRIGDTGAVTGTLRTPDATIRLEEIRAIWVRRPARPAPRAGRGRAFVAAESAAVLDDLWASLEVPTFPALPDAIVAAAHKSRQLRLAASLGFEIPVTLTGNDPDAFLELVSTGGGWITKRAAPSQRLTDPAGRPIARMTEAVRPRDLVHADDLRQCPILLQSTVPKALELRATVVGDEVLTVAIHSQATHHTRLDWRRFDHDRTPVTAYELDPSIQDRCRTLVRKLGLAYGAIDLVLTPDGRIVFLEVNPNGQYLWLEMLSGIPISDAVADWLQAADLPAADRHLRRVDAPATPVGKRAPERLSA